MRFKVGDLLRNKISKEEGRIMRIADLPRYGSCYVVSVAPDPAWGTTGREVIWQRSELTRSGMEVPQVRLGLFLLAHQEEDMLPQDGFSLIQTGSCASEHSIRPQPV